MPLDKSSACNVSGESLNKLHKSSQKYNALALGSVSFQMCFIGLVFQSSTYDWPFTTWSIVFTLLFKILFICC